MQSVLDLIKKILPKSAVKKIRPIWHGFLTYTAAVWYRFPSRRLYVIGVTGTAGKSTTIQMLSAILNSSGKKCGFITTPSYFDGNSEHINPASISMPGRARLQRYLAQIVKNGCGYAIVEATSEGLQQNRHLGIDFNMALVTNLDQAHIEAHGGFENYRASKAKLLAALEASPKPDKIMGLNLDSEQARYYLSFNIANKFGVSFSEPVVESSIKLFKLSDYHPQGAGSRFKVDGQEFYINLAGQFNVYNAALAAAACAQLNIPLQKSSEALRHFTGVMGRMERILNDKGIDIYVDFAAEPIGMRAALQTVRAMPHKRIIHVFGSPGGHRDISKRFEFGKISAENADLIIITNDDVYDSDPQQIAENIKSGIEQAKAALRRVKEVQVILDRRGAIEYAMHAAGAGDIVLITGKGSEQFISLPGNKIVPWDDKKAVIESIK